MPWHHDPNKLLTKLFVEHSSFILNMQKIGLFVFPVLLNVSFWHKVDIELTNYSFQCWWVGGASIGLTPSPVLEVLPKPVSTLFVKKPFIFWRKKNF